MGTLIWALVGCGGGGSTKKQENSAGDLQSGIENDIEIVLTTEPDDDEDPPEKYYTYALHHVLRTLDEDVAIKNVVLYDIDGCGHDEMIVLDQGAPESDDFWGATAKGFRIVIYDAKFRDRHLGKLYFMSDEITYATYKVYVTKKNDLVVYDSFEGEVYRVFRYSKGTLLEVAVLVDAYGEYFINDVDCDEAQFLKTINEYGIANADNVSFMLGKGKMEWEAPFDRDIPEKSNDIDRIL